MLEIDVLDCTLRDGGHHTNWHFSQPLVNRYLKAVSQCGVNWVELGYRRPSSNAGPWDQCQDEFLTQVRLPQKLKYAVMIDLKDYIEIDISNYFSQASHSKISMIRIAAHYHHIEYLERVSKELHELGYIVGVNLMRSGQVKPHTLEESLTKIEVNPYIKMVTFADSFGSMDEKQVESLIINAKKLTTKPLGFHAHDNKQLALRNTLKAIELGAQSVDATISGMGKGPGNTAMEFLLVELQKKQNQSCQSSKYNPRNLASLLLEDFYPLKRKLGWGSDLFSYIAAEESIHPDKIELLRKNYE